VAADTKISAGTTLKVQNKKSNPTPLLIYGSTIAFALTSFKEKELVEGALKAGAIGYLLKDISAEELANAIRAAYAGKPTLAPEAAQVLIQATRQPDQKPGFDLTEREHEVLVLMTRGMNNIQIAEELVVSLSTAKFHVSSILSKIPKVNRCLSGLTNHLLNIAY